MIINTPISLGELIDKISILQIKKKNIEDIEKQKLINPPTKKYGGKISPRRAKYN